MFTNFPNSHPENCKIMPISKPEISKLKFPNFPTPKIPKAMMFSDFNEVFLNNMQLIIWYNMIVLWKA